MSSGLLVLLLLSGLGIGGNIFSDAQYDRCPSGWTEYESRCYYFKNTKLIWVDAEQYCTDHGGYLASFHNDDEYYYIRSFINDASGANTKSWVGGTKDENSDWTWSDGSDFSYTHWGPGEPNNAGGHENCVDMNWGEEDYVNDEVCSQLNAFVCTKNV